MTFLQRWNKYKEGTLSASDLICYKDTVKKYKESKVITYFHTSNPANRESILSKGLIPSVGAVYELHHRDKEDLKAAVFLMKDNPWDSTYDDDVYMVKIPKDIESKIVKDISSTIEGDSVMCYNKIDVKYITLIYEGTGESTF